MHFHIKQTPGVVALEASDIGKYRDVCIVGLLVTACSFINRSQHFISRYGVPRLTPVFADSEFYKLNGFLQPFNREAVCRQEAMLDPAPVIPGSFQQPLILRKAVAGHAICGKRIFKKLDSCLCHFKHAPVLFTEQPSALPSPWLHSITWADEIQEQPRQCVLHFGETF